MALELHIMIPIISQAQDLLIEHQKKKNKRPIRIVIIFVLSKSRKNCATNGIIA